MEREWFASLKQLYALKMEYIAQNNCQIERQGSMQSSSGTRIPSLPGFRLYCFLCYSIMCFRAVMLNSIHLSVP